MNLLLKIQNEWIARMHINWNLHGFLRQDGYKTEDIPIGIYNNVCMHVFLYVSMYIY